jgi:hypothetical protein
MNALKNSVQLELVNFIAGEQMSFIPRLANSAIGIVPHESDAVVGLIHNFTGQICAEAEGADDAPPQFSVIVRPSHPDALS